eukprot:1856407-Pleurochrysis_carterae.AAC.2
MHATSIFSQRGAAALVQELLNVRVGVRGLLVLICARLAASLPFQEPSSSSTASASASTAAYLPDPRRSFTAAAAVAVASTVFWASVAAAALMRTAVTVTADGKEFKPNALAFLLAVKCAFRPDRISRWISSSVEPMCCKVRAAYVYRRRSPQSGDFYTEAR